MSAPSYLAAGLRTPNGQPRDGLSGALALEAVRHLRGLGVTASALEPVVAQVLRGAGAEALTGKGPARDFVAACLAAVKESADRAPLGEHLGAVLRLLALEEAALQTGLNGPPPHPKRR